MVGISPTNEDALTQMFTRLMIASSIGRTSSLMDMAVMEVALGSNIWRSGDGSNIDEHGGNGNLPWKL